MNDTNHDTSLDGLRGLGASIVVFHHYLLGLYPSMVFNNPETIKSPLDTLIATTPLNLFIGGHFAVCIFFILSAHVLTRNHINNANGIAMISAMAKRYPRLGIPVFASVIICIVAFWGNHIIFNGGYSSLIADPSGSMHAIFPSLKEAFIEGTTGALLFGSNKFSGPLWSINIEFYGSIGVFLALLLLPPKKFRWRLIAYVIAIPLTWGTYYLTFILGMTISEMKANKQSASNWVENRSYIVIIMAAVGLFLGSVPMHHSSWQGTVYQIINPEGWRAIYHIAGAYLIIISIVHSKYFQKILSTRFFKFLGEISFSMYLIHGTIIQYFGHKFILILSPHIGLHTAVGIMLPPTILLTFLASIYFCRFVDKPAIKISNAMGSYIKKRCT